MSIHALSDAELVKKCQSGEWRAYNDLAARHQDRLFTLIYRYLGDWEDARDACQEVFLKAFRALPEFRGEAAFGTWIHRIGVNTVISRRREKRSQPMAALGNGGEDGEEGERGTSPPDNAPDPVQMAGQKEEHKIIQQAIHSLEEEQRVVVVLRDVEGYDYEEIAHMLGCPRGTVKSRLHRARLVLRDKLRSLLQEDKKR